MQLSSPEVVEADVARVSQVMRSGWLVGGREQQSLEAELAAYVGYSHGVGVSSWTTGAFLVLHTLGLQPEDEVIVPSYSFIATANVVRHVGAKVVFADIVHGTWNLDPVDVRRRITPRTKAMIGVDQIGYPIDPEVAAIGRESGLVLLRDAACSIGSRSDGQVVGPGWDTSITSFHARKIITAGEGGMIFTDDEQAAAQLRRLRHQGMSHSDFERHNAQGLVHETYPEVGYNFRLTDIQAAMLRSQFERIESIIDRRRTVAGWYSELLSELPVAIPTPAAHLNPNWQSYMIEVPGLRSIEHRDALLRELVRRDIPVKRGVMASHLEPAYADAPSSGLPVTERAVVTNILLPMHPTLTRAECVQVGVALRESLQAVELA